MTTATVSKGKVGCRVPIDEISKVNIGCLWGGRLPGFHNLDIRDDLDVDIVTDMRDLSMIPDNHLLEMRASNVLEHVPHLETVTVLREWNRVLKPGGKLWLSVPDFDSVFRLYKETGMLEDWLIYHMYGEQHQPFAFHYTIFNWPNMRALLNEAGFSDAKRIENLPGGISDASTIRDNRHHLPVALNVEATK